MTDDEETIKDLRARIKFLEVTEAALKMRIYNFEKMVMRHRKNKRNKATIKQIVEAIEQALAKHESRIQSISYPNIFAPEIRPLFIGNQI